MPLIGFLFGLAAFFVVVGGLFMLVIEPGGGFGTVLFVLVGLMIFGRLSKK